MRLLIVGALEGQLSEATKLAMQGGAKVAHASSIDIAMSSLRAGRGADLLFVDVMVDIPGLIAALEAAGRAGQVRVIAHELAEPTHAGLKSGAIDVVLDQNPDGEIRAAVAGARALALGHPVDPQAEPIEIGIFLRDNLR